MAKKQARKIETPQDIETQAGQIIDAEGTALEPLAKPLAVSEQGNMTIGGFEFAPTGLMPVNGPPSFEDWERVGHFLQYAHVGVQFWIGDWLNFGEDHYGEKYTQAVEAGAYEYSTLRTYAWVARNVPPVNRFPKVPFGHYLNLASLPASEQGNWARKVVDQNLSQGELRTQLRLAKRAEHFTNVPLPEGKYRIFYVDAPWQYDDSGVISSPTGTESYGRAEAHYPTMSIEELIEFFGKVKDLAMDDAMMAFWIPAPMLLQKPGPREVIEAAGFEPKAQFIWDKGAHNYGHYNSVQHELLVICTRGSCTPDVPTPMPASVVKFKPEGKRKHSAKPEIFRKIITRMWTSGPYIELFGRAPVEGWVVYGNDLALDIEGNRPQEISDGIQQAPDAVAAKGSKGKAAAPRSKAGKDTGRARKADSRVGRKKSGAGSASVAAHDSATGGGGPDRVLGLREPPQPTDLDANDTGDPGPEHTDPRSDSGE